MNSAAFASCTARHGRLALRQAPHRMPHALPLQSCRSLMQHRGGPNYKKGLDLMRSLGAQLDLDIQVRTGIRGGWLKFSNIIITATATFSARSAWA